MQIEKIYHKDLLSFMESGAYKKSKYLPISKIRGLSHVKNPRAKPDDLVLVMVFENAEMQGYLGVLPDDLFFKNEKGEYIKEHAGWLSCMWVNPDLRGKGIAKILINTVFEAWDYRILVTEFTPAAKGLYDRTGQFLDLAKPEGLRAYLRMNLSYLLPARNPEKWQKFKPLLKVFDFFFNVFNDIRLLFFSKKVEDYRISDTLNEEDFEFIQKNRSTDELMRRSLEDLNWIIQNPWLQTETKPDEESKRYHFSSVADFFAFNVLKLYDPKKQLIALLIISVRDKNLKIPYAYILPGAEKTTAEALENIMLNQQLNMLTVFHKPLCDYLNKKKGPFFMLRKLQRHYIISKKFEHQLINTKSIAIQDGDADAAFT
jgi:GNAT superfamily N-acetyltransferase